MLHRSVVVELARIRTAGYPTTLVELDAWYLMPRGANAADVYLKAFDAYVRDEELEALLLDSNSDAYWPAAGEPIPPEMPTALETYLAKNAAALALLAEAASIPECRYPVDLKAGWEMPLPDIANLRRATSLLMLQARLQVQLGQNDRSIDSVLVGLAAARSMHREPTLVSYVFTLRLLREVRWAVEQILGHASLTDGQLARLAEAFAGTFDRGALPRAMAGERALMLGSFDAALPSEDMAGSADAERSAYLGIMEEVMKSAADPLGHPVDIDAMVDALPAKRALARLIPNGVRIALWWGPVADAAQQSLLVGLAAKRYELAHGKLPERLEELVPKYLDAVPIDPCDGKPLRYKLTDTGAVIYSVGPDGTDNDGRAGNALSRPYLDGTDVIFELRR